MDRAVPNRGLRAGPSGIRIEAVRARAFTIPTDQPETDGTLSWSKTTLVVVSASAGGRSGLGYTYGDRSCAVLVEGTLAEHVVGVDAMDPQRCRAVLLGAVRNIGRGGIAACAISAIDLALWDLKAKLLDLPLATLLGRRRDTVPIYGSGGFTSYDDATLAAQLEAWVDRDGCAAVKMKVGSDPGRDPARVAVARRAIGTRELFVDGNGAYTPARAIATIARLAGESDVAWFEEPVSSDDLAGLRLVRSRAPVGVEIAAGEYCWHPDDTATMLAAEAVDVQQADVTRCGGVSGMLSIAALCEAAHLDLSGHCAPAAHLHVACTVPRFRHLEWFHDHVRIEHMLFDGAPVAVDGTIRPDWTRPGHGLEFRDADAARFEV